MKTSVLHMPAPKTPAPPAKFRPLSAKMAAAIRMTVEQGLTGDEAAKRAGLSSAGYWKGNKTPPALEYRKALINSIMTGETELKARAKAIAINQAITMLQGETSEATKLKLVELLTREASTPAAAVQVNVSNSTGYEFARPNQQIVEITAESGPNSRAPDTQSGGND